MRIALLTDGIWPFTIGGMQKHSYYLCKYLARKQIRVELYHTSKTGLMPDLAEVFTREELQYIQEVYVKYPTSDSFPGHYLRCSHAYSENVYKRLMESPAADIIYAKGLTAWKILEEKKKGILFPPVCINVHGYEYYQKAASLKSKLEQFMLRPAFKFVNEQADYIYSYGGNISSIIRKHIKGSKSKIVEVPSGIEDNIIAPGTPEVHDPVTFVFIGRYERRKGVEELFSALRRIPRSRKFIFHFISDIPVSKRVDSDHFIFHGRLNELNRILEILRNSDVLVCPSYAEGMPNVILEGMASGCAIIATDVGAVPVLVNDLTGWLIRPGSVKELAAAIDNALSVSTDVLLQKKQAAFDRATTRFLWENIIDKMIGSFKNIQATRKN